MLEKVKKYKEWAIIILLVAGWASTYLYDRKVRKDQAADIEAIRSTMDANWDEQFNFNGRVEMYMELDSK